MFITRLISRLPHIRPEITKASYWWVQLGTRVRRALVRRNKDDTEGTYNYRFLGQQRQRETNTRKIFTV